MEHDFDRCVFETQSCYQRVAIYHSPSIGNVLMLDGDAMIGEKDLIYTETLCCFEELDYRDRDILILGGGDGGVLHEVLKRSPKHVLMVEIDYDVIKACATHLRSVCGDCLDTLEGRNYMILIKDCLNVLKEAQAAGRTFDIVINDLTEYPVEKSTKGFTYDFKTANLITELSLSVLKPMGRLLARGNCSSARDYHNRFKAELDKLKVNLKEKLVYVPSFMEVYVLYEIWVP